MTKYVIVVDVQSGFQSLCNLEYVKKIDDALEKYLEAGYALYYTIDNHSNQRAYALTQECIQYGVHCDKFRDMIPLSIKCREHPSGCVYKDTFTAVNLLNQHESPDEIVMFGVASEVCVVSNALYLRARCPNAPIFIREDLCKGFTQEGHDSAMNVMRNCSINIINPEN